MFKDLTIIIPTLNEEQNIFELLRKLKLLYEDATIYVMDDDSKDKTKEIAQSFKGVEVHDGRFIKGLTSSVVAGIINCKTKHFVVMDADFQHPIEKIKEMVEKLQNSNIVIGNRISAKGWSIKRKIISKTASILANTRLAISGKHCKDPMSGFFGGNTEYIRSTSLNLVSQFELRGWKVLFDILKYAPKGIKISYVNYDFGLRTKGDSKLNNSQVKSLLKALLK